MLGKVSALLQDATTYYSTLTGATGFSIADPTEKATEILKDVSTYVSKFAGGGGFSIAEERGIVYRRMGKWENKSGMGGALEGMFSERGRKREGAVGDGRGLKEEAGVQGGLGMEGVWEWIMGMIAAVWLWICMMLERVVNYSGEA